jgi:hypothetical protein
MPADRPNGIEELYVSKAYKRKEKSFPVFPTSGKLPPQGASGFTNL